MIRFIQITAMILISMQFNLNAQNSINNTRRPNIIFILTDDQRWDALGYADNDVIHTPNMDKLAEEGVYFKNAYVTTPICAASRASIMTGLYERKHGYTFQQAPLSKALIAKSYFALLKEAGYYNGYLGKFGVKFENKLETELFDVYHPYSAGFYYRLTNGGKKHKHLTDIMGEQAIDFIKNAPSNKPFCLTVSYNAPHAEDSSPHQFIYPQDLDTLYKDIVISEAPLSSDQYFNQQPEFVKKGFNRVRWHWRFDTPEKYQTMVKGYYRMISGIDRTIGKIRNELKKSGLADNTIIIFMSDNGYFLGERQFAGKWLMYEASLRVPFILHDSRNSIHKNVDENVLNIDIAPTILDYAGVKLPETIQGISLVKYTTQEHNPVINRDAFLCEHLWDFKNIPASEGIRTKDYKYFRYRDYPNHEEMYDLKNDPLEKINLAGNKEFEKKLIELREKCDNLIDKVK